MTPQQRDAYRNDLDARGVWFLIRHDVTVSEIEKESGMPRDRILALIALGARNAKRDMS